jgi:hypothetical protein
MSNSWKIWQGIQMDVQRKKERSHFRCNEVCNFVAYKVFRLSKKINYANNVVCINIILIFAFINNVVTSYFMGLFNFIGEKKY